MKFRIILSILFLTILSFTFPQVNVSTQHNNLSRTGENVKEIILNIDNVNQTSFGKIFTRAVDDQIYAQPLIISGVNIPGKGKRNVVFVATVNNSVYAFDAETPSQTDYLWKTSFLSNGVVPPRNTDMTGACGGNYLDFSGNMGIVGTPVIDTVSGILYVVSRTKEGSNYVQKLHALYIADGKEIPNSPVTITATYPGTSGTNNFDAQRQNQRPGLLLLNGIVYIGWASHCDWGPYHGWFLGYDTKTLQQKIVYNTTPNGESGGIWMSGQAPSADESGNIYLVTGNGTVGYNNDPKAIINRGESSLKLTPNGTGLTISSWFTPYNYQYLENGDIDLGSSGPILLPGTKIAVFGGKDGVLYVVNRDNMGGLNNQNNDNQIVQSITVNSGNDFHGSTIYYNGPQSEFIYMWIENDFLKSYKFDRPNGKFIGTPFAQSTMKAPQGMPGGILSSSSWGQKANTGIIWATHPISGDANHETRPGIIRAFDANNITKELWNSEQNMQRDKLGSLAKFNPPTIANGKLYMATFSNQLVVYGLLNTPSGLIENSSTEEISIYPNPGETDFTIKFGEQLTGQTEINVYNVLGRKVISKTINSFNSDYTNLDLTVFPSGTYTVILKSSTKEIVRKIIKK